MGRVVPASSKRRTVRISKTCATLTEELDDLKALALQKFIRTGGDIRVQSKRKGKIFCERQKGSARDLQNVMVCTSGPPCQNRVQ